MNIHAAIFDEEPERGGKNKYWLKINNVLGHVQPHWKQGKLLEAITNRLINSKYCHMYQIGKKSCPIFG